MVTIKKDSWTSGDTEFICENGFINRLFISREDADTLESMKVSVNLDIEKTNGVVTKVDIKGFLDLFNGSSYEPKGYNIYFNDKDFVKNIYKLNTLIDVLQEFKEAMIDAKDHADELLKVQNDAGVVE